MTVQSCSDAVVIVPGDTTQAVGARPGLVELARYFVASAIALGVDAGLYDLGLHAGLGYAIAAVAGFIGGLAVAYLISVRWAFRARRLGNARIEFIVFAAIGLLGLLLTESLLWLQIDVLAFGPVPAKLAASCGVFFFNFGARKLLLFKVVPGSREFATS
jgi:putative flippase GtrA